MILSRSISSAELEGRPADTYCSKLPGCRSSAGKTDNKKQQQSSLTSLLIGTCLVLHCKQICRCKYVGMPYSAYCMTNQQSTQSHCLYLGLIHHTVPLLLPLSRFRVIHSKQTYFNLTTTKRPNSPITTFKNIIADK